MKKGFFLLLLVVLCFSFYKKIIVFGMIIVGTIVFPEASQTLRHYCFGDGSILHVKSDYIKNSPVVKKYLEKMSIGEKRKVVLKQSEDWRLSYAINPFTIEKKKNKVIITQWIKFDKSNKVITWFGPIPIPDNIVHTFDCKPFLFYCEWDT